MLAAGSRKGPSYCGLHTLPSPAHPFALSTLRRTSGRSMKSQAKRGLYFYTVFDFTVLSGCEPEQGEKREREELYELQTKTDLLSRAE